MSDTDTTTTAETELREELDRRGYGPPEYRRAATELDVNTSQRIIELVAAPYDVETPVEFPPNSGRVVIEQIDRAAFRGVEARPNRVKGNREHDVFRTFGKCVALHPSRTEGLVAEIRASRTPLGDETLELARDGVLEASVSMGVKPTGQVWAENRTRRRVTDAWLFHIALCAEGAYGEHAGVIDVRTPPPPEPGLYVPTPLLDAALEYQRQIVAQLAEWRSDGNG